MGDTAVRAYVYSLAFVLLTWLLVISWLATRAGWRFLRRHHRSLDVVASREAPGSGHLHA